MKQATLEKELVHLFHLSRVYSPFALLTITEKVKVLLSNILQSMFFILFGKITCLLHSNNVSDEIKSALFHFLSLKNLYCYHPSHTA